MNARMSSSSHRLHCKYLGLTIQHTTCEPRSRSRGCLSSSYIVHPAGCGKSLLAVRIVFLNRVQNLQIHVMRANQYILVCIFSQFSEFRIQNMHSTLYVYFQSIFRNMHQNMRLYVSENRLKIQIYWFARIT